MQKVFTKQLIGKQVLEEQLVLLLHTYTLPMANQCVREVQFHQRQSNTSKHKVTWMHQSSKGF